MKPVSDQPPLPLPPRQGDVPGVIRWAGDLTRQLFTYLRELSLRLNHAFTDDNVALEALSALTADETTVLTDIADGTTPSGGDVSGPSSVTDGNIAVFDGATGKAIEDSGKKPSDFPTLAGSNTFAGTARFNGAFGVGRAPSAVGGMYFNRNPDSPFLLFSAGDPSVSTTDIGQFRASLASHIIGITGPTGAPYYISVNTSTGTTEVNADPTTTKGIATKGYVDAADAALSARITALGG